MLDADIQISKKILPNVLGSDLALGWMPVCLKPTRITHV